MSKHGKRETFVPRDDPNSYYGRPILKPPAWDWRIPAYLFAGGLSAGSTLLSTGADLTGRPVLRRRDKCSGFAHVLRQRRGTRPKINIPMVFAVPGHQGIGAAGSTSTGTARYSWTYRRWCAGLDAPSRRSVVSGYLFDQMLVVLLTDPKRMWGVFGNSAFADTNPRSGGSRTLASVERLAAGPPARYVRPGLLLTWG